MPNPPRPRSTGLILPAVVAVAALVAWLLWEPASDPTRSRTDGRSTGEEADTTSLQVERTRELGERTAAEASRDDSASSSSSIPARPLVPMRLVRHDTGQRVPNHPVFEAPWRSMRGDDGFDWMQDPQRQCDPLGYAKDHGHRRTTDEDGIVWCESAALLGAELGELAGTAHAYLRDSADGDGTTPQDLVLLPRYELTIRALAPHLAAAPSGERPISVHMYKTGDKPIFISFTARPGESYPWTNLPTLAHRIDTPIQEITLTASARIGGLRVQRRIPMRDQHAGSIVELSLPRSGSLRVLVTAGGIPLPSGGAIEVAARSGTGLTPGVRQLGSAHSVPVLDGLAEFPSLSADDELYFRWDVGAGIRYPADSWLPVPNLSASAATGVPAEARLDLPLDRPVLWLRPVNEDGKAMGTEHWFSLTLHRPAGLPPKTPMPPIVSGKPGTNGELVLPIPEEFIGVQFERLDLERNHRHGEPKWVASLAEYTPFRAGIIRLGDVRMAPPPLLVAGEVTPAPDAPCNNYSVHVEHRLPGSNDWTRLPIQDIQRRGNHFAISGQPPKAGALRLVILPQARVHIPPDPIPFAAGDDQIAVQLERGHTLVVHVNTPIDKSLSTTGYRLRLKALAGEAATSARRAFGSTWPLHPSATGRRFHRWNGLLPGRYRIQLLDLVDDDPLWTSTTLEVPRDPEAQPPTLDLDSVLSGYDLEITSDNAESIQVAPANATNSTLAGRRGPNTTIRVWAPPGRGSYVITARGHQPTLVERLQSNVAVRLEPLRYELVVEVTPDAADAPIPPLELQVEALDEVPLNRPTRNRYDRLGSVYPATVRSRIKAATTTVPVHRPGRHRVIIRAITKDERRIDIGIPPIEAVVQARRPTKVTIQRPEGGWAKALSRPK